MHWILMVTGQLIGISIPIAFTEQLDTRIELHERWTVFMFSSFLQFEVNTN